MFLTSDRKFNIAYIDRGNLCIKKASLSIADSTLPLNIIIFLESDKASITRSALHFCMNHNCKIVWLHENKFHCLSSFNSPNKKFSNKKGLIFKKYYQKKFNFTGRLTANKIKAQDNFLRKKVHIDSAMKFGIPFGKTVDSMNRQAVYNITIKMVDHLLKVVCNVIIDIMRYPLTGIISEDFVTDIVGLYRDSFSISLGYEIANEFKTGKINSNNFSHVLKLKFFERINVEKIIGDIEEIFVL